MSGCVPIDADAPRSQPSIPAVETMALSPRSRRTSRCGRLEPEDRRPGWPLRARLRSQPCRRPRSPRCDRPRDQCRRRRRRRVRQARPDHRAPRTTCCRGPRQGACRSRRNPTSLRGRALHARHESLDTDTAALGNGERLDVAVIGADLGAHRRTGTNLHLLAGLSSTHELRARRRDSGIPPSRARHGDIAHDERDARRTHRQPLEVVADTGDILEQALDGRRDGDLTIGSASSPSRIRSPLPRWRNHPIPG